MAALVDEWQRADDRRAVFLNCYMLMTSNMLQAIDQHRFEDPEWVRRLLHLFADYYFVALDAHERAGAAPPAAWAQAFEAAAQHDHEVLQDLLLGVNAHINYDLVLVLVDMLAPEWATLSAAQRALRYRDHCRVNDVISETTDLVQATILAQYTPRLALIDRLFGNADEWLISRLVSAWREEVWQHALAVLAADEPVARAACLRAMESAALQRGRRLLLLPNIN